MVFLEKNWLSKYRVSLEIGPSSMELIDTSCWLINIIQKAICFSAAVKLNSPTKIIAIWPISQQHIYIPTQHRLTAIWCKIKLPIFFPCLTPYPFYCFFLVLHCSASKQHTHSKKQLTNKNKHQQQRNKKSFYQVIRNQARDLNFHIHFNFRVARKVTQKT